MHMRSDVSHQEWFDSQNITKILNTQRYMVKYVKQVVFHNACDIQVIILRFDYWYFYKHMSTILTKGNIPTRKIIIRCHNCFPGV